MQTPDVIEGYRGARAERNALATSQKRAGVRGIPEGKTVFQFTHTRYRLQLTAPEEVKRSDGTIHRAKALVVSAAEGMLVLDTVKDAETIERIKAHGSYGQDFWDFANTLKATEQKRKDEAIKFVENASPEVRAEILAALATGESDDFDLPKSKPPVKDAAV